MTTLPLCRLALASALAFVLAACAVAPTAGPTTMNAPGSTDTTTGTANATGTTSAPKETKTVSRMVCKSAKEERVLEMQAKQDGCELLYTRAGATRSIATSRVGDDHCQAVRSKTQSNLERSGYRCN